MNKAQVFLSKQNCRCKSTKRRAGSQGERGMTGGDVRREATVVICLCDLELQPVGRQ